MSIDEATRPMEHEAFGFLLFAVTKGSYLILDAIDECVDADELIPELCTLSKKNGAQDTHVQSPKSQSVI